MEKICASILCVIMLVAFSSEAFAANWREGKKVYRSVCMDCHKTKGEAGRLSLDSRTRAEWSAFFSQPPVLHDKQVWERLGKDDISNLEVYFRRHAQDVAQLSGCG